MATREITVTVAKSEWRTLRAAAECAGMSLEAYVSWGVRLLALESGTAGATRRLSAPQSPAAPRPRKSSTSRSRSPGRKPSPNA
ncbi:hypothetical protein [Nocardia tenerifensis]|uniref:hypothetical protein n=1 Tax=Nocardia tenerifensis TaxID=228006 RepID=UPI000594E0E4|nr:hypothetical protein [Nocardia tenerifensis]